MNIAKARLHSQHIGTNLCASPEDVVRSLGALQSQDYAHSLWAIGLRTRSATISDVEKALFEGKIIRTWLMRGTVHIIPAEDITWMRALFSERILARLTPKAWAYHDMTPELMERAKITITQALHGKTILTRKELINRLAEVGIPDDKQQSYFIFGYLSQSGIICPGPPQDKTQTFALLDDWATNQRVLTREQSLAVLAERFFVSHGPATIADFVNWSGLKVNDAKLGLAAVQDTLISITQNDAVYWMSPDVKESEGLFLLPGYDEYLIGYKDRSPSFETYGQTPISTYNGMFYATIVEDGQVLGVWKRVIKPKAIDVVLHPVKRLEQTQIAQIEDQITAYSAFLNKPVALKVKDKLEIAEKGEWGKNTKG